MPESDLDLEASLQRLTVWLTQVRNSERSPAAERRELLTLADHLMATAEMIERPRWLYLEEEVKTVGHFGFKATAHGLIEIADTARRMANDLPHPNAKPELKKAANLFLAIWHEAGKPLPTIYVNSEAATAFRKVLEDARYVLSSERVCGLLGSAIDGFHPFNEPDFQDFFVFHQ